MRRWRRIILRTWRGAKLLKLRHFTEGERWGDFSRMSGFALWLIDELRERYGKKAFIVHRAFETSGHADNSKHYTGEAIDFYILTKDTLREQYEKIERILEDLQVENRVGFGVYPQWDHPGFHIDVRPQRGRWMRKFGEYIAIDWSIIS